MPLTRRAAAAGPPSPVVTRTTKHSASAPPASPSRRSPRLNPASSHNRHTAEAEASPRKRQRRSSDDAVSTRTTRNRGQSATSATSPPVKPEQPLSNAVSKGNDTEQPSGILPLSVVDVGVVKGLSVARPPSPSNPTMTLPVVAPSVASSSLSELTINTPGAGSPPLEANPSPPPSPVSSKASPKSPPTSPATQPATTPAGLLSPISPMSLPAAGPSVPSLPVMSPLQGNDMLVDSSMLDAEYTEEDAEGEPDESLYIGSELLDPFIPPPNGTTDQNGQEEARNNPANASLQNSSVPRISSPLKAMVSYASDEEDDADMEEIITINARQSEGSVVSRSTNPTSNLWESACKWRIWELQKRYNLHPQVLRSYEEQRADGFWRRNGWPSDMPHGQGRGLLTRSPTLSPIKNMADSPSSRAASLFLTPPLSNSPSVAPVVETEKSNGTPAPPDFDAVPPLVLPSRHQVKKQRVLGNASAERPITRSRRKTQPPASSSIASEASSSSSTPLPLRAKGKGKGMKLQVSIPSEERRVTRSIAAATPSPSNSRKRPASMTLTSQRPRKSARLSAKQVTQTGNDREALLGKADPPGVSTITSDKPDPWWDDDDSLSDLTESDEEKVSEPQKPVSVRPVTEHTADPETIAFVEDDEDDDSDDDSSLELSHEQKVEFEKLMSKGDDEAFLNQDLTMTLASPPSSPIESNSPTNSSLLVPPTPNVEPAETTFFIQTVQTSVPSTPLSSSYMTPQMQLSQFPLIPPLSSIPVPGLRQLDLSVPKPPNSVELGGRRQGERQLGYVGGWGTPISKRRRSMWSQAKWKGKEKATTTVSTLSFSWNDNGAGPSRGGIWAAESEEDEDTASGRSGTLKRRERVPHLYASPPASPAPASSSAATQMLLSQFTDVTATDNSGGGGSYAAHVQQTQTTDWTNIFTTGASSSAPVVAPRPRSGVEVDTPEWEAFINGTGPMPGGAYWGEFLPGTCPPGAPGGTEQQPGEQRQTQGDPSSYRGAWSQWSSQPASVEGAHAQPPQPGQFLTTPTPDALGMSGWDFPTASTSGTHGGSGSSQPEGGGPSGLQTDWTGADAFTGATPPASSGWYDTSAHPHQPQWVPTPPPPAGGSPPGSNAGGELRYALG